MYNKIPNNDFQIIICDFNAEIGKETLYRLTIGEYNKNGECKVNGRMLIDFETEKQIRIMTKYFDQKSIHETTEISPDKIRKTK